MARRMDDMGQDSHRKTVLSNRTGQAGDKNSPDPKSNSHADWPREKQGVPPALQITRRCNVHLWTRRPNTHCTKTHTQRGVLIQHIINLLAPELFFLILAHPVYKM